MELSPIKAIEIACSKVPGAISLAQGIPSFETPKEVKDFIIAQINDGKCDKYSLTHGLTELREEIAVKLNAQGYGINPDSEIIITVGSIEAITASILSITDAGDEIILFSPSYASYAGAIRLARCTPVFVPLNEDLNFSIDISVLEKSISQRTKGILICNPNNPTGTVFSKENLESLFKLAQNRGITIITDEVYDQFYYVDHQHVSPINFPQGKNSVIRCCSFSKSFAMTGWRVGFMHSSEQAIARALKFHDAMVTCAPVASQYGAIAALRFCDEYVKDFREEFRRRRDICLNLLDGMSQHVDFQVSKASYFVFPRIKDTVPYSRNSKLIAYDILEKAKVALVPGVAFGPSGEGHLRISFGRTQSDIVTGLTRLKDYFENTNKVFSSGVDLQEEKRLPLKYSILHALAKIYFLRHKEQKVIGIAGTLGKTICKRIIEEKCSQNKKTRSTLLSFNTLKGFPLSVLSINPIQTKNKLILLLKALYNSLIKKDIHNYLILEYGVESKSDSQKLLSIKKPDFLIVMPTETTHEAGVKELISQVDKTLIANTTFNTSLAEKTSAILVSDSTSEKIEYNGTSERLSHALWGELKKIL